MRLVLAAVAAALVLAAPATAQTVATVDGAGEVTKEQFDHWMRIAARSAAGQDARRARVPRPGTPRYRRLRNQVMELLLQNLWVQGEAEERGIEVGAEEVRAAFREQRRQSFARPQDFRRFLRQSGFTVPDLLYRARLELLSQRLRDAVQRSAPPVTDEDVRAEYERDASWSVMPERRDVRFVRARTRAGALAGRPRLQLYAERGQFPPAVFRSRRGLVRWRGGWLAFRVLRVHPRRVRELAEVAVLIRDILRSERQQETLDAFIEDFRARWRERTSCQERYATSDCGRITPARR